MPYKVLVNDLTVNADGGEITDLFGNVIGHQTVSQTYPKGAVLEDDQVAESLKEAVDNGETEGFLEKVGDSELDKSRETQEPFPGYSDLDVDQVQALFKVLPSDAIRAVVEFENSDAGEGRAGIADYHIGRGEAFSDRVTGRAGSPAQDGEEKPELAAIQTREVEESDVTFGLGPLDDGQPQVEIAESQASDGESVKSAATAADSGAKKGAKRGSRASKSAQTTTPPKDESGDVNNPQS